MQKPNFKRMFQKINARITINNDTGKVQGRKTKLIRKIYGN